MQAVAWRRTMAGAAAIAGSRYQQAVEHQRELVKLERERLEVERLRLAAEMQEREAAMERRRQEWRRQLEGMGVSYRPSFAMIEERICRATGVTRKELRSNRRNHDIVMARQAVMYWACRLTNLSLPQIGKLMGGRDHTTVLHGKTIYVKKRAAQGRTLRPAR